MKIMRSLLALGALAASATVAAAEPTPTSTPLILAKSTATPVVLAKAKGAAALTGHAWMDGSRLLVSGSAVGLQSEKDAKDSAVKDAAATAADFLDKKQIAVPSLVRRAIEDNILRETPIQGEDFGDLRVEDLCQERWRDENGLDRWSMTLTLSLRVGKGMGH
jgi:hypothetical protein